MPDFILTPEELMNNPIVYTIWETAKGQKRIHSQYTHFLDAQRVLEALQEDRPKREYTLTEDNEVNRWVVLPEGKFMWCVEIAYHPYRLYDWQYENVRQYLHRAVNLGDGPIEYGNDFYEATPVYPGLFRVDRIVAEFRDDAKEIAFRLFTKYIKEKSVELAEALDNANNYLFNVGML